MDKSLRELICISRRVGKDAALTQGASGNTSVKTPDGKFMFVKASGTALKEMNAKRGWCKINLQKIREIIKDKKRETEIGRRLIAACEDKRSNRPSIETNLHAFLDKYVIHLHPIAVCAFLSAKNGKAELENLFADEKPALLWVPYANPGYSLAKRIAELTVQYQKQYGRGPRVLFLQKHGLFVSATTAKEAIKLVEKVIKRCETKLTCPAVRQIKKPDSKTINEAKQIIKKAFFKATGQKKPVHFFYNKIISIFADKSDTKQLLKGGSVNPNEIIYCGGPAMWAENLQKEKLVPRFKKRRLQSAIIVKNLGLFAVGSSKQAKTIEQVVCGSLLVRYNAQRLGGIAALTGIEQKYIRNCGA